MISKWFYLFEHYSIKIKMTCLKNIIDDHKWNDIKRYMWDSYDFKNYKKYCKAQYFRQLLLTSMIKIMNLKYMKNVTIISLTTFIMIIILCTYMYIIIHFSKFDLYNLYTILIWYNMCCKNHFFPFTVILDMGNRFILPHIHLCNCADT